MSWIGHVAYMGKRGNAFKFFLGRYEGKRLKGRPKHRWEDNFKMDLKETEQENVDWNHLAHDRDP
jgi:hypothetical protein